MSGSRPSSARTAHPRSRGENGRSASISTMRRGSSPLTRGKQTWMSSLPGDHGLIPAHAGKTVTRPPETRSSRAHPRSRGENRGTASMTTATPGSSPLTRGKLDNGGYARAKVGLIPAHAGKTFQSRVPAGRRWAHPRSRGENSGFDTTNMSNAGSSPLTRGKRSQRSDDYPD